MTLCRKMNHAINMFGLHQLMHHIKIAYISLQKRIVRFVLNISKIGQIACIGQFININYVIFRIFINKQSDNVRANKSSPSCNYDSSFIGH